MSKKLLIAGATVLVLVFIAGLLIVVSNNKQTGPAVTDIVSADFNPATFGKPHPKTAQQYPDCCNHPYWHKVYRAISADGISWTKQQTLLKDHASVPDAIQLADGSYILYYVNGAIDTMDCSVSKDGNKFTDGNCTIYGFSQQKAWDPYVVKIEDDMYRMYYFTPPTGLVKAGEIHAIRSAVSKDGIDWLEEPGVRYQQAGIIDPAVIKMGDTWRLYTWYGDDSGNATMVTATSKDGLKFTKDKEFDAGGGIPEVVQLDSGQYGLYVCEQGIELLTSSDGVNWTPNTTALPAGPGEIVCDPSVFKNATGQWEMYYKVQEVTSNQQLDGPSQNGQPVGQPNGEPLPAGQGLPPLGNQPPI